MQNEAVGLIKPKWNATIATKQVTLLESVDSRELKITGGGMHVLWKQGWESRNWTKEILKALRLRHRVSEPVVNESNIEVQPKVWSDAPIIEEYESDSDDEFPHRVCRNKGIVDSGVQAHEWEQGLT
ncbi:hypothetical protein Tco_1244512 [Tanacetum coccineum]